MNTTRRNRPSRKGEKPGLHRSRSNLHTLWDSVLEGIADLTSFANPAQPIPLPHADAAAALRGDWIKIGLDMGRVIERQQHASAKEEE